MINPESFDPLEEPSVDDLSPADIDAEFNGVDESLKDIDDEMTHHVEKLRNPLSTILRKLGPKIDSGTYSTIIVDDASGRIPGIMMREILNDIYAEHNIPPVITRFIAGSTVFANMDNHDRKEALVKAQMLRIKRDAGKRSPEIGEALIVTDTIASGDSVSMLLSGIRSLDWSADIATIAAINPATIGRLAETWNNEVVYGTVHVPSIYQMTRASGMKKDSAELHARPAYTNPEIREKARTNINEQERIQDGLRSMRAARTAARRIAKEIAEEYLKSSRRGKR